MRRPLAGALLVLLVLTMLPLAACQMGAELPQRAESGNAASTVSNRSARINSWFESCKSSEQELIAFLHKMPKGADLHNHPSGAIDAEDVIRLAAEQGLYYDRDNRRFTAELPTGPYWSPGDFTDPTKTQVNPAYSEVMNDLTMRTVDTEANRDAEGRIGHDHFFDYFTAIHEVDIPKDMLIEKLIREAVSQRIAYLELMTTYNTPEDVQRIEELKEQVLAEAQEEDGVVWHLEINYIASLSRTVPLDQFEAQLANATAKYYTPDLKVAGITILAPEDNPIALRDYDAQMDLIDAAYAKSLEEHPDNPLRFSLHAGELTLENAPYSVLSTRLSDTLERGHAVRVDHGAAIAWDNEVYELLTRMREENIGVTVCLTSNEGILDEDAFRSQFALYRSHDVPVSLATDDEGIVRTNLTAEYAKAVQWFDLSYPELRELAQTGIRISLLSEEEKAAQLELLEEDFAAFEEYIAAQIP
jgi:adenosine deaminase